MQEIVVQGRAGQGALKFSQMLAIAAGYEGKYVQAFPMFGIERRGAPLNAFIRIDDKKIDVRSQIYDPDIVVVLDETLFRIMDVAKGLKKKGILLVNSKKEPKEIAKEYELKFNIHCFDATSLSMSVFKKPIANIVMLAMLVALTGVVKIDSLNDAIDEVFEDRKDLAILNRKAVREAFEVMGK